MNNSDPTAELRGKIVSLTLSCPKGLNTVDCPFKMLGELCYGTKMNTLKQMDYAALVGLFDYSYTCACPADPRHAAPEFLMGGSDI